MTQIIENLDTASKYIYDTIISQKGMIESDRGSLLNNSGCALFLYHYSDLFDDENAYEEASNYCDKLITNLRSYHPKYPGSISLCSGVLGSAWTLNYLRKEGFVSFGDDLDDLDALAEYFFYQTLQNEFYDYLHGALGALYYLLSLPKSSSREEMIEKMLKTILSLCNTDQGLLFLNNYDIKAQKVEHGVINLGLSHGTPSLIPVLCLAVKYSD